MNFQTALWDGSDPLYTPCSSWSGATRYWKAPKKYISQGYKIKSLRLPGSKGDGQDIERATKAREHTRAMLAWFKVDDHNISVGSVAWIVDRYMNDKFSPYRDTKSSTRTGYQKWAAEWVARAGKVSLSAINFEQLMRWKLAMNEAGRSTHYIHNAFKHLRIFISHGVRIESADCLRIKSILSEIRIKQPRAKTSAPTPSQVESVITAAERAGERPFALGLMFQWWWHLSPVDVRGQYLKIDAGDSAGGITRGNTRWLDGLTWEMFDREITFFEKARSKTERFGIAKLRYDLTITPEIQTRLLMTPPDRRLGPVIIKPTTGLPYSSGEWSMLWRKYADQVGLPRHLKVMDIRAGATTDGSMKGATRTQLKNAAQHQNENTTERYMRSESADLNLVVKLRRG